MMHTDISLPRVEINTAHAHSLETVHAMWLPEPVYEALPYLYLAFGAAFVAGAVYIGAGHAATPYYFGLGVLSVLAGVVIHLRRSTSRKQKKETELTESH